MFSTVESIELTDGLVRFDPLRPWLPGPPPIRRQIPVQEVDDGYKKESRAPLHVPINTMRLSSALELNRYSGMGNPLQPAYVFHGCGNKVSSAILESFSKWGPSIRFSRPRGYFSCSPAVYWTNSLAFAIGWCAFTETGQWLPKLNEREQDFECVVYVSKVIMGDLESPAGTCLLSPPSTEIEETDLVNWCNQNVAKSPRKGRIPPPGCVNAEWSIIGSRIPKHTVDGLGTAMSDEAELFKGVDVSQIWIYAACDESSSVSMANLGVEIIHVTNKVNGCQ
ncbi:hypothetical protein EJ05DRAFT_381875 [Pseudovirgaria hyperparasitica]|uniref:Uncharacterized protein n=1 Tax=Pseudovirgaria hyperparasitica TaxID=470096 RepID=A0A6A6W6I8_9PEZI|nr:uncharacterized protein EJ05DRAFT_381875 [Pseudovirgaria hyperparasitica]KAF2758233.1 hypothetical protein EJ05DRAFT_381875 [Pseudovirgaria hyperparasitica]